MRAAVSLEPSLQDSGTELASVSGAVLEWKMQGRAAATPVMYLIGRKEGAAVVTGKREGPHSVGTA